MRSSITGLSCRFSLGVMKTLTRSKCAKARSATPFRPLARARPPGGGDGRERRRSAGPRDAEPGDGDGVRGGDVPYTARHDEPRTYRVTYRFTYRVRDLPLVFCRREGPVRLQVERHDDFTDCITYRDGGEGRIYLPIYLPRWRAVAESGRRQQQGSSRCCQCRSRLGVARTARRAPGPSVRLEREADRDLPRGREADGGLGPGSIAPGPAGIAPTPSG